MRVIDKINAHQIFPRVEDSKTGGHRLEERDVRGTSGIGFNLRVVWILYELSQEAMEVGAIATFKRHLAGVWIRTV